MNLSLQNIFESLILEEISRDEINDAINNKYRVNIFYDGDGINGKGKRTIEVYGYGLNHFGNLIIRAYQVFGDTKTKKPAWKTFRTDRISKWEKTGWKYNSPINQRDPSAPKFNPNSDKDMSRIYNLAKF
jgi:hypothetical protein